MQRERERGGEPLPARNVELINTLPQGSTPVPDPTKLTQEAVDRAKSELRNELSARFETLSEGVTRNSKRLDEVPALIEHAIKALRDILETRLNGYDTADELLRTEINLIPQLIKEEFTHLQKLNDEKFTGVVRQFAERDVRVEQSLSAQKEAVSELNKSNTEAIRKAEATTNKAIDSLDSKLSSMSNSNDGKIADLKDRMTSIENKAVTDGEFAALGSRLTAIESRKEGSSQTGSTIFAVIGAAGVLFGILVAGFALVSKPSPTAAPIIIERTSTGDRIVP